MVQDDTRAKFVEYPDDEDVSPLYRTIALLPYAR